MWDYVNMDVMFATTLTIEQVVVELGETPFKPLKEELEEGIIVDEMVEKQVNSFIESLMGRCRVKWLLFYK